MTNDDETKTALTTTTEELPLPRIHSRLLDQEKVRTFIRALLANKPAVDAADEAGFDHRAIGGLLRRRDVRKALRDENAHRNRILTNTRAKVQAGLSNLAYSDVAELFDNDLRLKPLTEMPADARAAISAVSVQEFTDPDGKLTRRLYRIQLERKQPALETLAEVTGLTTPNSTNYLGPQFQITIHLGPESVALGQQRNRLAHQRPAIETTTTELPPPDETRN